MRLVKGGRSVGDPTLKMVSGIQQGGNSGSESQPLVKNDPAFSSASFTDTQAHVFVCMLAYLVARQIEKITDDEETVSDALQQLNRIALVEMALGKSIVPAIPAPPPEVQSILDRLSVSIPGAVPVPSKTKSRKAA